jgi:hypothetical protein
LEDGRIALSLPPGAREFMVAAAGRLQDAGASPTSPGFEGVFGPIDESAVVDDPAYVLERQLAVDEVLSVVSSSVQKDVIEPEEAEAWLKLLGMTLSRRTAELGVRTEADRAALAAEDEAEIRVVYALQMSLIDAIDGSGAR